LHELRMLEQQLHHLVARRVVARLQPERLEVLVLANQLRGCVRQDVEEVFQVFPRQRVLQVFDDVELDVALAQEVQRAARLASAGVVVDEQFRHGRSPREAVSVLAANRRRRGYPIACGAAVRRRHAAAAARAAASGRSSADLSIPSAI
jgi:hypothetical protein